MDDNPQFAVVTQSDEWGWGATSWHHNRVDAEYNANVTEGRVVPVDYIDGEMIVPPLARAALQKGLSKHGMEDMLGFIEGLGDG
jgi:hypothetical protein